MKIHLALSLVIFVSAVAQTARAQDAPVNPLTRGEKTIYGIISHSLVAGAEKMPETNYSFQPTPDIRTFAQLVGHAANAQYSFCSAALGEKNPSTVNIEKTVTTKTDLVQALKSAVDYCGKAYAMTDAQSADIVKFFGHDAAKLTILSFNNAHSDEHYGNMVTYLRLKGIVPPTSESQK